VLLFDISGSVLNDGLLDPLLFERSILDGLPNVRLAIYGFSDELSRARRRLSLPRPARQR
jgi:hypothetical protein